MKMTKLAIIRFTFENLDKCAKQLHTQNENACNYGLSSRQEKRVENIEKDVEKLAKRLGLKAAFCGDPRCASFVLHEGKKQDYYAVTGGMYF